MSKYYMSVDLGTSSVRAFIADLPGRRYFVEGETYEVIIPRPGYAEQDPKLWYEKAAECIRRVLRRSGVDPADIGGVSFSGQMHGAVTLDEAGEPVHNAIIWMDQRSGEVLDDIYAILGERAVVEYTQNRIAAGYMVGTLYWLKQNRPELYRRIHRAVLPKDYIKYRLCGAITTDYSDAAGSLAFDNKRLCWAEPMLERLGSPRRRRGRRGCARARPWSTAAAIPSCRPWATASWRRASSPPTSARRARSPPPSRGRSTIRSCAPVPLPT